MSNNIKLRKARTSKKDEFYTQLSDIENELKHYQKHFRGKTVLCNCDDPRISNFFHYFSHNFEKLKLKKLITTCYKNQQMDLFSQNKSDQAIYLEYCGDKNKVPSLDEIGIHYLKKDGDFRSTECVELLKQSDIVVTNPPFSLFREYIAQLMKYKKKFIIIGHQNAITYKEIFKLIKENKIWLGYGFRGGAAHFITNYKDEAVAGNHEAGMVRVSGVHWFTNLDIVKHHEDLILHKKYNKTEFPTYDNYDAIEVSKTKNIPIDYNGLMGVPITFMDKYNPDQFEIIWTTDRGGDGMLEKENSKKQKKSKPGINSDKDVVKGELLEKIKDVSPYLFEKLMVILLEKMGYGVGITTQKSHDGGIDGIVTADKLGLSEIYVQTKRYSGAVPIGHIKEFIGTIQTTKTKTGVFITSGALPESAHENILKSGLNIQLIDGEKLSEFMYNFDVGVKIKTVDPIKYIDEGFFVEGEL